MTPNSTQPQLAPDGTISLTLTIPASQIAQARRQALQSLGYQLELPGFRKGKAPLSLVEARLNPQTLLSRTLELAFPPAYNHILRQYKLQPLAEPELKPLSLKSNQDWLFEVTTAQAPPVQVGNYRQYLAAALHKAAPQHTQAKDDSWRLQTVFDALLAHAQVTPSPFLVQKEASAALRRLHNQLASLKLTLTDYLKSLKKNESELKAEYAQTALANLKLEFILQELIKLEKITITPQQLQQAQPRPGDEAYVTYLLQKRRLLDKLTRL